MNDKGNIIIYQTKDGQTLIDVRLENETVWINRQQMAELFDRDVKTIGKHITNALKEELKEIPVVAKFATTATDGKTYQVEYYNLEMITSIGYRVKSQQGIQFRIWANKVLKEYLIKGYAINEQAKAQQLADLKNTVRLLSNVIEHKELTLNEANGLLHVITDYTYGLDTLDKYDYQRLEVEATTRTTSFRATYEGRQYTFCKRNLEVAAYSEMKRTNHFIAPSILSIRHLMEKNFIPALKKKQPCFSI